MKGGHSPTSFGKSGNLEDFRTNITHLKLFSKEILRLTRDVQFEVICFAVGLIRRHFSSRTLDGALCATRALVLAGIFCLDWPQE